MLLNDLKDALDRGVNIRILTGNYLNITQPSALYLLKDELKNRVDLRFYNNPKKSFHTKAYMFHNPIDSEIYRIIKYVKGSINFINRMEL